MTTPPSGSEFRTTARVRALRTSSIVGSFASRAAASLVERPWRAGLFVFLWALGLRALFALILADTYDPDEFVILALSKAVSQGANLYGNVTFFQPPGLLFLFAPLQRVVSWWWPSGRVIVLVLDSFTAVFVWRIGRQIWGMREGFIAGLIYGASPIALVSGVRIGPDPVITALGVFGLLLLLTRNGRRYAIGAAVALAIAVWVKYTALLYLPVYLLATRRHRRIVLVAWAVALAVLFAPHATHVPSLVGDTVLWQLTQRAPTDVFHRIGSVGAYWLLLNPLAAVALWRARHLPLWLPVGFALGTVFLLTSQAYYHYFVLFVPFGALLAAPLLSRAAHRSVRVLATVAIGLSCLWAVDIANGAPQLRLFVTASHFSAAQKTARILDRTTPPGARVLTDEFEYGMLARRPAVEHYFWNMNSTVRARTLEHRLLRVAAVVETKGSATYPPGFEAYLAASGASRYDTAETVVWVLHPKLRLPPMAGWLPHSPSASRE